jgi:predicted Rossmann-fold nucleotide-binding protein
VTVEIFESRGPVNPWVRERIHTRTLFERIATIVSRADGFVVAPGSVGTLAELFLTWNLLAARALPERPLVLVGGAWEGLLAAQRHPDLVLPELFGLVRVAAGPDEAARLALDGVAAGAARRGEA